MSDLRRAAKGIKPIGCRPLKPDPAVTAARVLDRAADRYAAAFEAYCTFMGWFDPNGRTDWGDDVAIVRGLLEPRAEPALAMLSDLRHCLKVTEDDDTSAFAALTAIQPTSTRGFRCYRAAVGRYARRSTGHAYDEAWALGRLSTEITTG